MDIKNIRQKLKKQKEIEQSDPTFGAPGPAIDNLQNTVDRLVKVIDTEHDNIDADLAELNAGHFDTKSDGTQITNIFDANGVIKSTDPTTDEQVATKKYVDDNSGGSIMFWKGQHIDFIEDKSGTKFEDATLFDKITYATNESKIGGTNKSHSNGTVPALVYDKVTSLAINVQKRRPTLNNVEFGSHTYTLGSNATEWLGWGGYDGDWISADVDLNGTKNSAIAGTSGSKVLAAGYEILHVTYIAKKDITQKEMQ